MLVGLTAPQNACLKAIERLTVDGVSPTFAELRDELGLASKSGVHRLMNGLKERGAVTFLPRSPRSVRVLPTAIGPNELQHLSSAELRTTAAHIAGLLAHREGSKHADDVFDPIAKRIGRRPDTEARS
jgi:SOS-response transcriptional repressor LexA